MKIHLHLHYHTEVGESLVVRFNNNEPQALECLNADMWHGQFEFDPKKTPTLSYYYELKRDGGRPGRVDFDSDRVLDLEVLKNHEVDVFDHWNPAGAVENVFFSQPFQEIFLKRVPDGMTTNNPATKASTKAHTHVFRVKAPLLEEGDEMCLLGHGAALRNWDSAAPLRMHLEGRWWTLRLDLSDEDFPLSYKYGVWNSNEKRFKGFENGGNRSLYTEPAKGKKTGMVVLHDGFARLPLTAWRGAGVAIPVFSLRSEHSFGVGEFTDLHALADWAASTGLKLIQLLPVNDTTATHTWIDSYPYSAVSAFALHPMYLNVAEVAGKKNDAIVKAYGKKQKELNALSAVDYEAVMQAKWAIIRQLFAAQKEDFEKDAAWKTYFEQNKHWLLPYAAFCFLRDLNHSPDFSSWSQHKTYDAKQIEKLCAPDSKHYDEIAMHYFAQWHLHRQLSAATAYAHQLSIAVKGDIPIGIYRNSCDAWMAPELYNMDCQAGAPPDDFAVNGQNWGFPTYNWARMKADGFKWWRQRFEQMSLYFDAFRIDHILGFFRIWSIPLHAVEGILGHFVPAIPVRENEFYEAGVGFNHNRLCEPFITNEILFDLFGDGYAALTEQFLERTSDAGQWTGNSQYRFKPDFNTQRKVEAWFEKREPDAAHENLRENLYRLIANVVLLEEKTTGEKAYHFRFGIEQTSSFRYLPEEVQGKLKALYVDYFFRRQDAFWQLQALDKLPELKRSTNMLICGEDLGMVPACVPDVMEELGILSLEIQRMPKKSGSTFFHPKNAPYLSVVTPSTHDMSTLRGWWEEDRKLTQRFFNEELGYHGTAPWYCEPWANAAIVQQHVYSPSMWSIFQLQDLLGSDGDLRREDPSEERINVPANPKHYWRYRMHMTLEALQKADKFNAALKALLKKSGRG